MLDVFGGGFFNGLFQPGNSLLELVGLGTGDGGEKKGAQSGTDLLNVDRMRT